MKIAVECKSPLMQKSLELFLDNYLSSLKHCDIVLKDIKSDDSRSFFISSNSESDLIKPFSKSQLILALEKRYESIYKDPKQILNIQKKKFNKNVNLDFDILEKRINSLTAEYQNNILKVIKAFYEE